MMSQSALKRGLIDPQIQKARRAKMQQMASKAYAAKISSKQMPYIHSMYQAYHNLFWKGHDELFINELKTRSDSFNVSMISKRSSAVSSSVVHDIEMLKIDDKQNQPDQSNISKEMKKRRVNFGEEQMPQSEIKLMKKKEEQVKNAIESKSKYEQMERQLRLRKEEELKKAQKEKQVNLAKEKEERQQLKKKKRQEQKQKEQREAAIQAEKIKQRNRQQLIQEKQAQTRQINQKIQLQKKKIRQIEEQQRMKVQQRNLEQQKKVLPINQKKQQQNQQQEYQQIQEQCGPSYYEMMSNNFSNSSKYKNEQIENINNPTTHKSMIMKSQKKQQVYYLSSLREEKQKKNIQVPSSSKEESVNARKEKNQKKGNLVHSNSNKSQDYRKSINSLSLSEANSQKKLEEVQIEKSIKVDPISEVVDQAIINKQKIEQIQEIAVRPQVQMADNSQQLISLRDPSGYLDQKREDTNQLNEQKDTSAILAQLNFQQPKLQESPNKNAINSQILESFQEKPKLQSSYSLEEFRIDGHTIDHLSKPSLKIVEQQKQKKDKIQQIIVEQDINPSLLSAENAYEQHLVNKIYDQSKIINADDAAQQINIEQKVDAIIYELLLNIDQQSDPCPQCTSNLIKKQVLIKRLEELQLKNKELIYDQEEFCKKARQNTISLETKILNLENQKHILAQTLENETFYLVNPGGKGQKRKNSESCLPQKNNENKKQYNSEQQSGKNSSDNQQSSPKKSKSQSQSQKSD